VFALSAGAIITAATLDMMTQLDEFEHPTVTYGSPDGRRELGGQACISGGGGMGGGPPMPPRPPVATGGPSDAGAPDSGIDPNRCITSSETHGTTSIQSSRTSGPKRLRSGRFNLRLRLK